jgi:RHS repeat-associated protein
VTDLDYTTSGRLEWITDPRGYRTRFEYNSFGDVERITGPLGDSTPDPNDHVTRFEYDDFGRRTAVVDPMLKRTETTYDGRGRVTRRRQFDGTRPIDTTFAYPSPLLTITTDPNGHATDEVKDVYGRLWRVFAPAVNGIRAKTEFAYDEMSNLWTVTDAEGRTTTFEPDPYNRIGTITYPDQGAESFTYNAAGRLLTRTRGGVVTTYGYDDLGRLESRTYTGGTPAFTFTYDQQGHVGFLTSASHDARTLAWTYDLAGQVKTETAISPNAGTSVVAYEYDLAGNRLQLKLNGSLWAQYAYDDASRLDDMWREGTALFDFKLNDAGYRTSLGYPNGAVTSYVYDDLWRLLSSSTTIAGPSPVPITSAAYTYADDGNRLSATLPWFAEAYVNDPMERLQQISSAGGPTTIYGYDKVGNRDAGTWVYNDVNQLESTPTYTFTYDVRGNLAAKTGEGHTWVYEWNGADQLKRVTRDQVEVATFRYDALGRRIERTGSGRTYSYVYDGEDILREDFSSVIEESGLLDPPPHRYVHGPGIDEPLAVMHGTGAHWYYHADGLGSIVTTTDNSGGTVFSRHYDAWGGLGATGSRGEGYAYTGREWDPETELYYYRARYYDPKIGRFISEDPLPLQSRRISELNAYGYVANNPVNLTDPFGLESGAEYRWQWCLGNPGHPSCGPPPSPPVTCESKCEDFLFQCNALSGGLGMATGFICGTGANRLPLGIRMTAKALCGATGAGAGTTLQLGCVAGYQECLRACAKTCSAQ